MQFVVIGRDGKDAQAVERRLGARQAHLDLAEKLRQGGRLLYAAALLNERGEMGGSVLVMDFESRQALDRWLEDEPYVLGKVWEQIEVSECRIPPSFARKSSEGA